ncbi:MAG: TlpA disulfide reductase family protein [Gaiellales bacterium]
MGKASRNKRERRDNEGSSSSLTPGAAGQAGRSDGPKGPPVFWIVVVLVIIAGVVAIVVTSPTETTKTAVSAAADAPVYGDIDINGKDLPGYTQGTDAAEGKPVPAITGRGMKNQTTELVEKGEPTVIMVMAHWCPHCNVELPKVLDWSKKEGKTKGVRLVALSTAAQKGQADFPPGEWLAKEGWKFDVIFDDEADSASETLGVKGYPFVIFVDKDGKVSKRASGEMPIDDFDREVDNIRVS